MGCFAHTMNLIVQSALTLEEDLINKTKNIVSHFRKSTVANNSFKTYQLNNGIKNPKKNNSGCLYQMEFNILYGMQICRVRNLNSWYFGPT